VRVPSPADRLARKKAARQRATQTKTKDDLDAFCGEFHASNPWVYSRFVEMAKAERTKGRTRYGAKTIMERLRWEAPDYTQNSGFKLPNTAKDRLSARYARMLISADPSFEGFFELRCLSTEKRRDELSAAHKKVGR
jgi:hypothetical protein